MSLNGKFNILLLFCEYRLFYLSNIPHIIQKKRNNNQSKPKILEIHSNSKTCCIKSSLYFNPLIAIRFRSKRIQLI